MLTNTTQKLLSLSFLLTLIFLTACQKDPGVDLDNPPPIPSEIKDSTFLIKSIVWIYNDGKDSIVEHYSYDTVNKRITLAWTDTYSDGVIFGDQSAYHNTKAELSYNTTGLLSRVVYTYPASYVPFEYDYDIIDIAYDPDNIVQNIATKYKGGATVLTTMNKTALPSGGYELKWTISEPDFPDNITHRTAVFSNKGKNIVSVDDYRFMDTSPNGNITEYKISKTDSLAYDANDNVTKITRTPSIIGII